MKITLTAQQFSCVKLAAQQDYNSLSNTIKYPNGDIKLVCFNEPLELPGLSIVSNSWERAAPTVIELNHRMIINVKRFHTLEIIECSGGVSDLVNIEVEGELNLMGLKCNLTHDIRNVSSYQITSTPQLIGLYQQGTVHFSIINDSLYMNSYNYMHNNHSKLFVLPYNFGSYTDSNTYKQYNIVKLSKVCKVVDELVKLRSEENSEFPTEFPYEKICFLRDYQAYPAQLVDDFMRVNSDDNYRPMVTVNEIDTFIAENFFMLNRVCKYGAFDLPKEIDSLILSEIAGDNCHIIGVADGYDVAL